MSIDICNSRTSAINPVRPCGLPIFHLCGSVGKARSTIKLWLYRETPVLCDEAPITINLNRCYPFCKLPSAFESGLNRNLANLIDKPNLISYSEPGQTL